MNQEFGWDQNSLSVVDPVVASTPHIIVDMACDSVKKMESGKAAQPPGVVSEMVIAGGEECMKVIADLINSIIRDGKVLKDWVESHIVNLEPCQIDFLFSITRMHAEKLGALNLFIQGLACRSFLFKN